ncbi:MAG: hypothetical protein AABX29_04000 [Nanoarchaeota archaeon]
MRGKQYSQAQETLSTQICFLTNYPSSGLIIQICPNYEFPTLGFIFKGRLFVPEFKIGTSREWLELRREYRNACEVAGVPIIGKGVAEGFFMHPYMFHDKVIGLVQAILTEAYES